MSLARPPSGFSLTSPAVPAALVAMALAALCACRPAHSGPDSGAGVEADLAQYDALVAELDQRRTLLPSRGGMDVTAAGTRLFWLELPGFSPTLHSYDAASGAKVNYAFSVGTGTDAYNYFAGAEVVVTAQRAGDKLEYRAYRADAPEQSEGVLRLPLPSSTSGVRWWAYAVDGRTVYYVRTEAGAELFRWNPGEPVATRLFDLSEAGITAGEFTALGVAGDHAVVLESGRLWRIRISTRQATWLGNRTEVTGPVSQDADGVLFPTAEAPLYYRISTGDLLDVGAAIAASPFRINTTFAVAHQYRTDPVLLGRTVVYAGKLGLFSYNLDSGEVRPLLLEPNTDTDPIRYVSPRVVGDDILYVVGLRDLGASVELYHVSLSP